MSFDLPLLKYCTLAASILIAGNAFAQEPAADVAKVNAWYAAISPTDDVKAMQQQIDNLLSEDAMIVLKDLDIEQSKQEFLDSLEGWQAAIEKGYVAHKIETVSTDGTITGKACYHFGGNAMMTRDVFTVSNDLITRSVQTGIADNCNDF